MSLTPLDPELSTLEIARSHPTSAAVHRLLDWLTAAVRANPRFRGARLDLEARCIACDALMRALSSQVVREERFVSRGPGAFRGYVKSMIDSVVLDEIQKRTALKRGGGAGPEPLTDSLDPGRVAAGHGPQTPSGEVSGNEQVEKMLSRLEPAERQVFELHALQGHDFPEIARLIDGSDSAHRSRFDRARRKLQQRGDLS